MRSIEDVLNFRGDISPFLIHLTRARNGKSAKDNFCSILGQKALQQSESHVSDARFAFKTFEIPEGQRSRFLSAICFTETPLGESHCLFEIAYRQVELEPYGLVFMKDLLKVRGVGPVFYVNNYIGDKAPVLNLIGELWKTHPAVAEKLVPLMSLCGARVSAPGVAPQGGPPVDFTWEREWRFPHCYGSLTFKPNDIFCAFCPDEEIEFFDKVLATELPGVQCIDPRKNMKWYASKLIAARQLHNLKVSVV